MDVSIESEQKSELIRFSILYPALTGRSVWVSTYVMILSFSPGVLFMRYVKAFALTLSYGNDFLARHPLSDYLLPCEISAV